MAEIASAYISLLPSAAGFQSKLNGAIGGDVEKAGKTSGSRFGKVFASASIRPIRAIGAAAIGLFAIDKVKDFFGSAIDEARESQKVSALTAQVIKTTGGAANISAKQIGNLSSAISNKVGIDDEAIQSGANMLLTFTNVRNEVGRGNKVFNQATKLAVDMSAALGGDAKSAALQLGKALNDPEKGVSKLARSGVSFTEQQIAQIKAMQKTGDVLGAQKIILGEVSKEFGGAAAASATSGEKMSVAWGNLKETIGTALLPVLDKAEGAITNKVIPAVSKFVTQMQDGTGAGGEFVNDLKQIGDTAKGIAGFLNALPGPVKSFGAEAAIAALVLPRVTSAVGAMGGAFALSSAKVKQAYAEMTYAETRTQKLSAVTGNLGGVMRQAAGVGGMALLIDGTRRTSSAMSALETTAGAAATGFAVGGPWGAAIGGGIGLITSLKRANDEANSSFSDSSKVFADYRDSLNQVNGAVQKQTLQTVRDNLQKNADSAGTSLDAIAKLYGVPTRDQIQAIAGNVDAFQRVKNRLKEQVGAGVMNRAFASDFLNFVRQQRAAIEEDGRSIRQNTSDISSWSKALRGLPKQAVTTLKQEGYNPSIKQLRDLQRQYKLTPKQIAIVIKQTGMDATVAQIVGKLKPLPRQTARIGSEAGKGIMDNAASSVRSGGNRVATATKAAVVGASSGAKPVASTGGKGVGIAMADGFASTVGGGNAPGAFAALVSRTYHAGMAAADAHSPSRKTKKLGQWMGDGLVLGLVARVKHAAKAGDMMARAAVDAAARATSKHKISPLRKHLNEISDLIGDGLSGKGKKGKAKVQEVKDSLGKLTDSIKKQLDKQLQAAKDKVSKIADTISSLKDTIRQTASSVAQNYLPDFTTNALFGPDGKLIKGTAVSSFKSQIAAQGSMLSQVTSAYNKLRGEGLNGDWLASLLSSGNNNLILDLGRATKADALSAQSMYQNVTKQANDLGKAVADHTVAAQQKIDAEKAKVRAQKELARAKERKEHNDRIVNHIERQITATKGIAPEVIRGLNRSIAAANNGRRS